MDCKLALLFLSLTSACLAFECLDDGAYRDAEDCAMYWVCDQTGMFHMPCPDGLYFNEGEGVCDWPENVLECPFECKEDGMFMDRGDCNKYYWCVGEQQFHMDCPEGLYFNNAEQGCDWPENVDECPTAPTDAPTSAAPTTDAPTTPEPTTPDLTTAAPTTAAPTTAAPTTAAPTTAAPTTAAPTTAAPTTAVPTTPGPTPAPFECPGDGFYMASTCVDYWRCLGNSKWLMPCPKGLWFNTGEEACDWPENVPECSMDPPTYPPTTAAPTTAAPTTAAPTTAAPTTAAPTTAAPTTAAPTTPEPTTAEPTFPPTYPPTTAEPTYPPTAEPTTDEPTTPEPTTPEPTTPEPTTPEPTTPEPTTDEPTTPEPTTPYPTTAPGPTDDGVCKDEWEDCDYESMCGEPELADIYCRQTCGKC